MSDQLELVQLLAANYCAGNGCLYFGPKMDDEIVLMCGPRWFAMWRASSALDEQLQSTLKASGVLASSHPSLSAVFCMPSGGLLQVRRHANRIVCSCSSREASDRSLATTLMLRVIGPLVKGRRDAARSGQTHPDNVGDVDLRLEHDDTMLALRPAGPFHLHDTAARHAVVASMRQVLLMRTPCASNMLRALVDYARYLMELPAAATALPPRGNVESVLVHGEIARYVGHTLYMERAASPADARLLVPEIDGPAGVRAALAAAGHLHFCPLAGDGHWTLLFFSGGNAQLFDSLAPRRLEQSMHYRRARFLVGPLASLTLFEIDPSQRQTSDDCGLFVIAMAVALIRGQAHVMRMQAREYAFNITKAIAGVWAARAQMDEYLCPMIYHMATDLLDRQLPSPPPPPPAPTAADPQPFI